MKKECRKLLFPLYAACRPDAIEDVAGFGDGRREVDAVDALALEEAIVGVGVGHLRDKLAFEAQCHGGILRHHGVEIMGRGDELVVGQLEGGELIEHVARMPPFVGDAGVEVGELEIVRTVEHACAERDGGPVEVALRTLHEFRGEQPGERQRGGDAEFIAVEDAAAVSSRLPFIVGVKLHAEAFAAAEEVAVGDSQDQTRSEVAIGFRGGVDLDGGLDGVFKLHDVVDVEQGMPGNSVDRDGLDLDVAEDAEAGEARLSAVHVAHGEKLALAEGDA